MKLSRGRLALFTSCPEEEFSETGLPVLNVLGNSGPIEEVDTIFFVQLAQGFLQRRLPAVPDAVLLPQDPVVL
jgi:hypothetical protein